MYPNPKTVVRTLVALSFLWTAWPLPSTGQMEAPDPPDPIMGSEESAEPAEMPSGADRPEEMNAFLARLLASGGPAPPAAEPALPPTRTDLERRAFETLRDSGHAPIVATPDGVLHPFGHGTPTLVCIPDRACDIVLEAGEVLDGLAVGDPARWQTTFLTEGSDEPVPHILIQPTESDLATNLVVVTSRRTYHVELRSPSEDDLERDDTVYHHLSWWYPDRWTRKLRREVESPTPRSEPVATNTQSEPEAAVSSDSSSPTSSPVAIDLDRLDFGYEIDPPWRRSKRLPWTPTSVFDDGRNVYLHLPPEARATDLPVVLGRAPDGSTYPVNAHFQGDQGDQGGHEGGGDWLVLPALFDEIELVTGSGSERRFLRIRRLGGAGGGS